MDLTGHWVGLASLGIFVVAYLVVVAEEFTQLRKSKPVMLAAGVIWAIIGFQYAQVGDTHVVEAAVREFLLEFAELFLFLLAAMTYVNSMSERRIFDALRSWLVRRRFGYRSLFWITGVLSFFFSAAFDNLTTALLMCAVILAVGRDAPRFISLGCVNIVVAANAGGAFSPFGDITTLMV
ncbi:MAG: sodium:proton antiporter NhaD, partial [Pseudomonadales bacterium]